MSHELRTPITTVVGLSEELPDSLSEFDAGEVKELVSLVADQGTDLATIVDDLLAAARAEAGSLHVDVRNVDATAEVMATLGALGLNAEVSLDYEPDVPPALADPGRLRQIVRNLVVNAQRYGTDPIRILVRSSDDAVAVDVRDCGPPLPTDQQHAIFDRYHRAGERPGAAASVGVGLTVSRQLARAMGGDVTYTHDGETVFTLTLPPATADIPIAAV